MKKICLFLLLTALLMCVAFMALASAKPGEEVTVTLTLNNTNAALVRVTADYDKNVFDLVNYSSASGTAGSKGIVMYDTKALPSGAVGTVTLKVKDSAAPGTYPVTAVLAECYDLDENDGIASVSGGTVIIEAQTTPAPTATPTAVPTATPTIAPTSVPTVAPTAVPTVAPTAVPTVAPTAVPTVAPTSVPTVAPTAVPTVAPTAVPTVAPTTVPTVAPTAVPTVAPTAVPTVAPTAVPTVAPTVAPTSVPTVAPTAQPVKSEWRYSQTVCSMGIRFQDIDPNLTNKWFMFTPIDLSKDGTQSIDLIAANISYVGKVTVKVNGGKVTVAEHINWPAARKVDLQFALLPDLSKVKNVDIKSMKTYSFGKEISIADDLGGDTKVLLYVFGHVDYDFKDAQNELFIKNGTYYQNLVKQLKDILD